MKNRRTKLLALILATLLLAGVLSACVKKDGKQKETTTQKNGTILSPDGDSEETTLYEKDDLPETLNYNHEEFIILCDAAQYPKSFAETYTGDVINSAIFNRYDTVCSRLNLDISIVPSSASAWSGMADFITQAINMGEGCDLVLAYNLTPALMAVQGLTIDLGETSYLNFEKPWWSSVLMENVSLNGKIYFTGDNSSWNNLRNMLGVFVDKRLFADNHPDMSVNDLYQMVREKTWTMDQLFELAKNGYRDTDQDGEVTAAGDTFGFSYAATNWVEAIYYGAGLRTLQIDENGEWAFQLTSSKATALFDYFQAKFFGNNDCIQDAKQYRQFLDGRAQFYIAALSMVEQGLEQPFTVIPVPMYQADQGRYYTHFSNSYDMYCIPKTVGENADRSSAVLECLASEAYRQIAPAYFETYLKTQHASDEYMQEMYDLIRDSITFDLGYCFTMTIDVDGDQPIYYVRRTLRKVAGYENLSAVWGGVNDAFLEKWKATVNTLLNNG